MKKIYDFNSLKLKEGNTFIKALTTVKKIILFPIAVVYTVIVIIASLIAVLALTIPIFLYKQFIIILGKCLIPGSKILANLDNWMAHGCVYRGTHLHLFLQLNLEGTIFLQDFVDQWETKVMKILNPDGKPKFVELTYYIKTWMGYSFYREDKTFTLENHIKLYKNPEPNSIITREKLDKIKKEFLDTLFVQKRSPWEILIVNNCINAWEEDGKEHTVIILKIHHCLADGYATLLLFWEAFAGQNLDLLSKPKSASLKLGFFGRIMMLLNGMYHILAWNVRSTFLAVYDLDILFAKSDWHDNKLKPDTINATLKPIDSSAVKEISRQYDVSITAVLTAVCSGGFRRMMEAKGRKSPKSIRTSFSLPLPNHPPRLTTHSFITDFEVPICNVNDKRRLQLIDINMKNNISGALFIGFPLLKWTLLPSPISYKSTPVVIPSLDVMSLSTVPLPMPTPESGTEILGCRLKQVYSACDLTFIENYSITFLFLKYKNNFFPAVGIQRYLLDNEEEIYYLEKYMAEELNYLRGLSIV